MGARIGITKGFVPLDLPLGGVGDVGLERHSQLHQVDGGGATDDNVWPIGHGSVDLW